MQTDGLADMRKLIVAFRDFAKASQDWNQIFRHNVLPLEYFSNLVNIISDYKKSIQP